MTGQTTIQEVLFFPQMRPEKVVKKDAAAKYMELGIAEEWVPVIQKAGYNTVEDMKDVNAQKLHPPKHPLLLIRLNLISLIAGTPPFAS